MSGEGYYFAAYRCGCTDVQRLAARLPARCPGHDQPLVGQRLTLVDLDGVPGLGRRDRDGRMPEACVTAPRSDEGPQTGVPGRFNPREARQ